jgi:DNA-binding protein HU-beta
LKKGGRISLVGFDLGHQLEQQEMVEILKQEKRFKLQLKNVVKFKAGAELEGAVNHYSHFIRSYYSETLH